MSASDELSILWMSKATKALKKIDRHHQSIILKKVGLLRSCPGRLSIKRLKGTHFFSFRHADYRVIFYVVAEDNMIYICLVGHRKDVYQLMLKIDPIELI